MGGAAVGVIAATALVAQMSIVSNASWLDSEWVSAPSLGTVDCTDPVGAFATRGEGRVLSGSLLGLDLDQVAEASGVEVTNNGQRDLHSPVGAIEAPAAPAWADPLNVGLLGNAINLDLGGGLLQLPLDNSTGAIGQFGSASTAGVAEGAAGFITSSGGIATAPGSGYPELATLKLSQLVESIDADIAATLANVTDVSLEVGALTGRAMLDGCDADWNGVSPVVRDTAGAVVSGNLEREYLTSSADLVVTTPVLDGLTEALDDTVQDLENVVNGLASDQGVLDNLLGAVNGLLGGLISGVLGLGDVSLTLTATVDTTALRNEIHRTTPLTDSAGVVSLDLPNNVIRVNTLGLLQAAYPGSYSNGLNALPPNTNVLADAQVLNTLTNIIGQVLGDWLANINALLDAAVNAVQVNVVVLVKLQVDGGLLGTLKIGTVTAVVNGSLADLLSGSFQASVTTDLNLGILGVLLKPVVEGLVNTLVVGLVNGLGLTVGTILEQVLGPLRTVPTTVTEALQLVVTTVSNLYSGLLLGTPSLAPILSVTVNAQNDPLAGHDEPSDWETKPGVGLPDGQYDVAALRIGVLEALANGVVLYLGRGSVGPVCSQAEIAAGECANY